MKKGVGKILSHKKAAHPRRSTWKAEKALAGRRQHNRELLQTCKKPKKKKKKNHGDDDDDEFDNAGEDDTHTHAASHPIGAPANAMVDGGGETPAALPSRGISTPVGGTTTPGAASNHGTQAPTTPVVGQQISGIGCCRFGEP